MALTVDQKNFVQELANLAWGTGGSSERAAGGKGNMGLLHATDGTVHVVKFNTHYSQAKTAQAAANRGDAGVQDSLNASNALRTELEKLATAAGLGKDVVDQLLGDNASGKSLLTRKVVAGFVSRIAQEDEDVGRMGVWNKAQAANLKSASDMSFDKVATPDAAHAEFNRAAVDSTLSAAEKLRVRNAIALENSVFASVQEGLHHILEDGDKQRYRSVLSKVGATRGEQRAWARNFIATHPKYQKYMTATTTAAAIKDLNDGCAKMIAESVKQGKRSAQYVNGFAGTFLRELTRAEVEIMTINGERTRKERLDKNVDVGLCKGAMESYEDEHIKATVEQLAGIFQEEGMRLFVTSIISHNGLSMALGNALMTREQDPGEGVKIGFSERFAEKILLGGSETIPQEIHIDVAEDGTINLHLKTSYSYKTLGNDPVSGIAMNFELANYPLEMNVTIPGGQHIAVGEIPQYTAEIKSAEA